MPDHIRRVADYRRMEKDAFASWLGRWWKLWSGKLLAAHLRNAQRPPGCLDCGPGEVLSDGARMD